MTQLSVKKFMKTFVRHANFDDLASAKGSRKKLAAVLKEWIRLHDA